MFDADETQTVFVYGSNLDPKRLQGRCPSVRGRRGARLLDHRLVFNKIALERNGSGYANVAPAPGEVVEGALCEMDRDDLMRLDRFEGHPRHYSRRLMAVVAGSGEPDVAWVYFATPEFKADGLVPQAEYLSHLLAGRDLLSKAYVARLESLVATGGPSP